MEPNPFLTIWTRPRDTVNRIIAEDPSRHVLLLICLYGIGESLNRSAERSAGDKLPLASILIISVFVGPLGGMFSFWIYSHLVRWTGSWIGGMASREHVKTALAWGVVPYVAGLIFWIPLLVMLGPEVFTSETPQLDSQPVLQILLLATFAVEVMLITWTVILTSQTVAEVQGFTSGWRGFGNLLLAVLVPFVAIIAIAFLAIGIKLLVT